MKAEKSSYEAFFRSLTEIFREYGTDAKGTGLNDAAGELSYLVSDIDPENHEIHKENGNRVQIRAGGTNTMDSFLPALFSARMTESTCRTVESMYHKVKRRMFNDVWMTMAQEQQGL